MTPCRHSDEVGLGKTEYLTLLKVVQVVGRDGGAPQLSLFNQLGPVGAGVGIK